LIKASEEKYIDTTFNMMQLSRGVSFDKVDLATLAVITEKSSFVEEQKPV